MPKLMEGLDVELPGKGMMRWQQLTRCGKHNLRYGSPARKALMIVKPLIVAVRWPGRPSGSRRRWRGIATEAAMAAFT